MKYLTFGTKERSSYSVAILVNEIRRDDIKRAYIIPHGLNEEEIIVIDLHQSDTKKKTPTAEMKQYIEDELVPTLNDLKVEVVMVANGEYFKVLTKKTKVDPAMGYVLDTSYGSWKTIYLPDYRTLFYDRVGATQKISQAMNALKSYAAGTYVDPGIGIIKFSAYPKTHDEIADWLDRLLEMDVPLTIDIEGFSLKHYAAGIGTISFCWSKTEGIAFPVDYKPIVGATCAPYGEQINNVLVKDLLHAFFLKLKQKAIYHNIAYDVYVLIYELFMVDLLDNDGLLVGLDIMLKNWDDTKLITYLATNSCAGNQLGLKDQSQEYAGDYAQEDIKDITRIPLDQLLQYNLVDGLATWFVYEKHYDKMVKDQQLEIYETLFKPATLDIIQMQLTGMPVNMSHVQEVKAALEVIHQEAISKIMTSSIVKSFHSTLASQWATKRNEVLKKKRVTPADFKDEFNPRSPDQLQQLLYEKLSLPILERTATKQPSSGGKILTKLLDSTKDPEVIHLLEALIEFKAVEKLLTAFIPALENSQLGPDGWYWLFGNFNLGGTVSGRLSSSNPNLQNLPANVVMKLKQAIIDQIEILKKFAKGGKLSLGKLIKYCFQAPPGWFFCGLDFASLEDRISALTTKDPNKLKVYTDGYDGHSLRAFSYFGDQMTGIIDGDVASINSIQDLYPSQRQESKVPTFLLTYGGTWIGIMQQLGWSEKKAKDVESKYHVLYKVSDDWVAAKLQQATRDGYVTVAFGLRVRTPLLHQTVLGTSKTPFQAEAEGRTAGNALGQSWGLLNSRAGSEVMGQVRKSQYRNDIRPCTQIHDAGYYLIRDDIDVVQYANTIIVKASEWQNHPDIWHADVKLGGEFSIFYPDWSQEAGIPNEASQSDIYSAFEEHVRKLAA